MATFQNTLTIQRPVEDVFAFLADFENLPSWNYAIVETKKTSPGPVGVGTTYRQIRSLPSRSEEGFEVTSFEPTRRLEIQGEIGPFTATISYLLAPKGDGTRLANTVDLQPPRVRCGSLLPWLSPGSRRRWRPTSTPSSSSWKSAVGMTCEAALGTRRSSHDRHHPGRRGRRRRRADGRWVGLAQGASSGVSWCSPHSTRLNSANLMAPAD